MLNSNVCTAEGVNWTLPLAPPDAPRWTVTARAAFVSPEDLVDVGSAAVVTPQRACQAGDGRTRGDRVDHNRMIMDDVGVFDDQGQRYWFRREPRRECQQGQRGRGCRW